MKNVKPKLMVDVKRYKEEYEKLDKYLESRNLKTIEVKLILSEMLSDINLRITLQAGGILKD